MKRFRAAAARTVLRLNSDLRDQLAAFSSQFILNLSLLAIVLVASFLLEPPEFVRLSLANSYIMLFARVFDFGLNSASLKLSIENNQPRFVDVNVAVKTGLFLISVVILLLTATPAGPVREVVIVTGAAGVAFWSATRVVEQYQRRFLRLSALNLALAASRIVLGGLALLSKSWVTIALAIYVAAQLPVHATSLMRLFGQWTALKSSLKWSEIRMLSRMAPPMFLSGALFNSLPVISQTAIYLCGDIAATGAFGIVLLFLGPLALVIGTLRIYVLPQILLSSLGSVDVFGLGRGSIHILVGAVAGLFLLGVVPMSFVLEWAYESRFPQIAPFLLIYFSAHCLTATVGIYNIRAYRGDLVWLQLAISGLQVALTAPLLMLPQVGALAIVIWSSLVLLGGELLLAWLLNIACRQRDKSAGASECP